MYIRNDKTSHLAAYILIGIYFSRSIILELVVLAALIIFWYEKSAGFKEELSLKFVFSLPNTAKNTAQDNVTSVNVRS